MRIIKFMASYGDEVRTICIPLPAGHGATARTVPATRDVLAKTPPYTMRVWRRFVFFNGRGRR